MLEGQHITFETKFMEKLLFVLLLFCFQKLFCQNINLDISNKGIDTTFTFIDTIQKSKTVIRVIADSRAKVNSILYRGHNTIHKTVYDSIGQLIFKETTKVRPVTSKQPSKRIYLKQTKYSLDGSYKIAIRKKKPSHIVVWYDKTGKKLKKIKCKDLQKDCDNDTWEQTLPYTYWYL